MANPSSIQLIRDWPGCLDSPDSLLGEAPGIKMCQGAASWQAHAGALLEPSPPLSELLFIGGQAFLRSKTFLDSTALWSIWFCFITYFFSELFKAIFMNA